MADQDRPIVSIAPGFPGYQEQQRQQSTAFREAYADPVGRWQATAGLRTPESGAAASPEDIYGGQPPMGFEGWAPSFAEAEAGATLIEKLEEPGRAAWELQQRYPPAPPEGLPPPALTQVPPAADIAAMRQGPGVFYQYLLEQERLRPEPFPGYKGAMAAFFDPLNVLAEFTLPFGVARGVTSAAGRAGREAVGEIIPALRGAERAAARAGGRLRAPGVVGFGPGPVPPGEGRILGDVGAEGAWAQRVAEEVPSVGPQPELPRDIPFAELPRTPNARRLAEIDVEIKMLKDQRQALPKWQRMRSFTQFVNRRTGELEWVSRASYRKMTGRAPKQAGERIHYRDFLDEFAVDMGYPTDQAVSATELLKRDIEETYRRSQRIRALEQEAIGLEVEPTMAPRTTVQTGLPGMGAEEAQARMLGEFGRAEGTGAGMAGRREALIEPPTPRAEPLPGQAAMPAVPRAAEAVPERLPAAVPEAPVAPAEAIVPPTGVPEAAGAASLGKLEELQELHQRVINHPARLGGFKQVPNASVESYFRLLQRFVSATAPENTDDVIRAIRFFDRGDFGKAHWASEMALTGSHATLSRRITARLGAEGRPPIGPPEAAAVPPVEPPPPIARPTGVEPDAPAVQKPGLSATEPSRQRYTADIDRDPPSVQLELAVPRYAENEALLRDIRAAAGEATEGHDAYDAVREGLRRQADQAGLPPPRDPPHVGSHGPGGGDPTDPIAMQAEMLDGFPGQDAQEAALARWSGARDTAALEVEAWHEVGNDLLEAVGIGQRRRKGLILAREDSEALFKALHGEGPVPNNLRNIYDDLIRLRDQETSDMVALDPGFAQVVMAHPDYFPRGWRTPKQTKFEAGRIGAKPGFLKPRIDATFTEMLEAGWEPLSWNPYDMMALRRIAGIEHRQNLMMVSKLKRMHLVAEARKAPSDWRVPRVGPAFEGRPYARKEGAVGFTSRLATPNKIADGLESVYGHRPKMFLGGIDMVDLMRKASNVPKRAKLFASLFQHVDFGTRAAAVAFAPTALARGAPLKYPSLAARLANVSLRKAPRRAMRAKILSGQNLYSDFAISLRMIAERGWEISGDPSVLRRTMMSNLQEAIDSPPTSAGRGVLRKAGQRVKDVARFFEDGLFEGVYRETQAWALENFIVPRIRKSHPNWAPEQVAASAASEVNVMFSSLGNWQTVFKNPAARELARSLIFSTNESEAWIRASIRTMRGPNKRLWREYALGMMVMMAGVGNLINVVSTGKPMSLDRYLPIMVGNPYSFWPGGVAYNNRFMSPTLPWQGKDDRPLFLDLVGQADTFFRWILDPPGALASRVNVLPRMALNQMQGETFWGEPLRSSTDRLRQVLLDLGVPISAGAGMEAIRQAIPGLAPFIPRGEERAGITGGLIQATGLNVRSGTNREVLNSVARLGGFQDAKGHVIEEWDKLNPLQQAALKRSYPEVGAIEQERKERFQRRGIIDLSSQMAAGDAVEGRLPSALRQDMQRLGVNIQMERTIAPGVSGLPRYFLNDEQYQSYQDNTARILSAAATPILASSQWQAASDTQKAAAMGELIKRVKAAARQLVLREVYGQATPVARPTPRAQPQPTPIVNPVQRWQETAGIR